MRHASVLPVLAGILVIAGVASALAQPKPGGLAGSKASAFEKLKQLVGEWEGTAGSEENVSKATVTYRVTAAGSAVVETLFPGTEHEMVTVYHNDAQDLVLTHYCAAGNQPRMKARRGGAPNQLVFEFAGGTNLKAERDMYMHGVTITFVDEDHIQSKWVSYSGGKQAEVNLFDLRRRK
jgi:hypothetical protein